MLIYLRGYRSIIMLISLRRYRSIMRPISPREKITFRELIVLDFQLAVHCLFEELALRCQVILPRF